MPSRSPASPGPATELRSSLHGRGRRLTPQRQKVLSLFERIGEGSHLSAEEQARVAAEMALHIPPEAVDRIVLFRPVEAGSLFPINSANGVMVIYTRH